MVAITTYNNYLWVLMRESLACSRLYHFASIIARIISCQYLFKILKMCTRQSLVLNSCFDALYVSFSFFTFLAMSFF